MFSFPSFRLVYYELNSDFRVNCPENDNDTLADPLSVPDLKCFKDIHGQSPLPPFTNEDVSMYLSQYNKKIGKASGMYEEGYLRFVRYCNDGKILVSLYITARIINFLCIILDKILFCR